MRIRSLALYFAAAFAAAAQNYTGPRPPRTDLPYLKHAENLVPTEVLEAKEEKGKKDDIMYVIAGAASSARTPLASPIVLLQTDKLVAAKLELFKLESRNGRREITFSPKKRPKAIRVELTRLNTDKLYRLEVDESLEPGEYAFSVEGPNQVFCFQVY
jgi:hypothetical protein